MSWLRSACTATTPRCRSWRRVRRPRGISGRMFVMIAPSAAARRRPRSITLREIARRSTQRAITPALCWAHARRHFFGLADIAANARRGKKAAAISPIALEAVKRIDTLFDIERDINGLSAEERLRVRQEQSAPLLSELEVWLRDERARLSRAASVAGPIDYMLRRWDRFAHFVNDGRICLTNNAAERALRGFALGRKSWLFAGSERGAARAAAITTLIMTAKLNDIDPQAWLADVLTRIADTAQGRLPELLPWEWKMPRLQAAA